MEPVKHSIWEDLLPLVICAALISLQLFITPFIGIADNGDFMKIAGRLSLAPAQQVPNFTYVVPVYIRSHKFRWHPEFVSSELIAAGAASQLEKIVGPPSEFDIRYLGAVHSFLFLAAFYLFLVLLHGAVPWVRFGLISFALWIFTDVFYVSYYNSFYSDAIAMLGLILLVVSALLIVARPVPRPGLCALFLLASLVYVTSKPQHALMAIFPAAFIVWTLWNCGRKYRVTGVAFALVLLISAAMELHTTPEWVKGMSLFDVVFSQVTKHSVEPERDLQWLGLDHRFDRYVGQNAYINGSPAQSRSWSISFYRQVGYSRLLLFYLRHPLRTLGFMDRDLRQWAHQMRPIGNFCVGDGHQPGSKTGHFAYWSDLRANLFRLWPEHVVLWYAIFSACAIVMVLRGTSVFGRKAAVVALGIAVLGTCEFAVATLADAAETNRHLFVFHVLTDITVYFAVAAVVSGIAERWSGSGKGRNAGVKLALTQAASPSRLSSNWGIPYRDGYAGQYICGHCDSPKPNGVYSVRCFRGPSLAYVWLCAECRARLKPKQEQPAQLRRAQLAFGSICTHVGGWTAAAVVSEAR